MEFFEKQKMFSALYESVTDDVRKKHALTRAGFDVLMFLKNNPKLNTATQIVKYRKLVKSQVSGAVAELTERGLVTEEHAGSNKKTLFLRPTAQGILLAEEGRKAQRVFAETLFRGFKKEEIDMMKEFFERAFANAENYFEEKKKCR